MKLTDALAKSNSVITEESERRAPTVHDVESNNLAWLRTPKGFYLFAYTRRNFTKDEHTLSITRSSHCGMKIEQYGNLTAMSINAIDEWIEENKKRILHDDFKDRKYILPYYDM